MLEGKKRSWRRSRRRLRKRRKEVERQESDKEDKETATAKNHLRPEKSMIVVTSCDSLAGAPASPPPTSSHLSSP